MGQTQGSCDTDSVSLCGPRDIPHSPSVRQPFHRSAEHLISALRVLYQRPDPLPSQWVGLSGLPRVILPKVYPSHPQSQRKLIYEGFSPVSSTINQKVLFFLNVCVNFSKEKLSYQTFLQQNSQAWSNTLRLFTQLPAQETVGSFRQETMSHQLLNPRVECTQQR